MSEYQALKDEHNRLKRPLDGLTKEQLVPLAQAKLQQNTAAAMPLVVNTIAQDDRGVYLTAPNAPSQYLPASSGQYVLKLDGAGKAYVTDGVAFSRYCTDFFPEAIKEPCRKSHLGPNLTGNRCHPYSGLPIGY